MTQGSVAAIIESLNRANVRYLVVGGLAVVAHGHLRYTADVDLVLSPDSADIGQAIQALEALGYAPRAPVPFADFANPDRRREWMATKGMVVFSLASPWHPATEVDLFVEPPFDFEAAFSRAARFDVAPGVEATFISREDLLAMKRRAGRPQDLEDIRQLGGDDGRVS